MRLAPRRQHFTPLLIVALPGNYSPHAAYANILPLSALSATMPGHFIAYGQPLSLAAGSFFYR